MKWFRVWSDMANDPKWRTIARVSGQKVGDVIAVYLHMLTLASSSDVRGVISGWCDEDIATALDITTDQVAAIREAMQDRVLDGMQLTGWEKRQPLREDNSTDRVRQHRERKRQEKQQSAFEKETRDETDVTQGNARVDKKREDKNISLINPDGLIVPSDAEDVKPGRPEKTDCPHQKIIDLYHEELPMCPRIRDWTPARAKQLRARWNEASERQNLDYWKRFFQYVATCDFLVGRSGNKPFFADLEWMTKAGNFAKIRERRYENRGTA